MILQTIISEFTIGLDQLFRWNPNRPMNSVISDPTFEQTMIQTTNDLHGIHDPFVLFIRSLG